MMPRPDFFQPSSLETAASVGAASESQFYGSLADRMARFSEQQFRVAAKVADRKGEQAGLADALAGKAELKEGAGIKGQAYNRGALRVYTAETTTDILRSIPQIEAAAYNDTGDGLSYTDRFNAAASGYRNGTIGKMPAQVRPEMQEFLDKQLLAAQGRVIERQAKEQRESDIAATTQALDDLADVGTQMLVNGEDDLAAEAGQLYEDILTGAVEDDVFSPTKAVEKNATRMKRMVEADVMARFDVAFDGGNGIEFIRNFADAVPANMSAETHTEVWIKLEQRLSRRVKHDEDTQALKDSERKERHREGKIEATLALMAGDEIDLRKMVDEDRLNPDWALEMEKRAKDSGPAFDDELTAAIYSIDPLGFTEDEILDDVSLTYETRVGLVQKRRELVEDQENWVGTQQGRQAIRMIRTALGIPEGISVPGMTNQQKHEAEETLTEHYDTVEAFPPEQRAGKAIEIARNIVKRVKGRRAEEDIPKARQMLEQRRKKLGEAKGEEARATLQQQVTLFESRLADLERRASNAR